MTGGYRIREATIADAETIVRHRREMFFDMGHRDVAMLEELVNSFRPWLVEKLSKEEYHGWFAIAEDGSVAAGAGVWLMNWPPGLYTSEPWRGNILNVYTEHGHRRRGLARQLVGAMKADNRSEEETAADFGLSVEAVREALAYVEQNKELVDAEVEMERTMHKQGEVRGPQPVS